MLRLASFKFLLHFQNQSSLSNPQPVMWSLFKEFMKFSRQEKKWWLIPIIITLLLLATVLIFAANSGIVWALYPFL